MQGLTFRAFRKDTIYFRTIEEREKIICFTLQSCGCEPIIESIYNKKNRGSGSRGEGGEPRCHTYICIVQLKIQNKNGWGGQKNGGGRGAYVNPEPSQVIERNKKDVCP